MFLLFVQLKPTGSTPKCLCMCHAFCTICNFAQALSSGCCMYKGSLQHVETSTLTIIRVKSRAWWQRYLDCKCTSIPVFIHLAHSVDDVLLERIVINGPFYLVNTCTEYEHQTWSIPSSTKKLWVHLIVYKLLFAQQGPCLPCTCYIQ